MITSETGLPFESCRNRTCTCRDGSNSPVAVTTRQAMSPGGCAEVVSRSVTGTAGAAMEASTALFCAVRSALRLNCQGDSNQKQAPANARPARMTAIQPGLTRNAQRRRGLSSAVTSARSRVLVTGRRHWLSSRWSGRSPG